MYWRCNVNEKQCTCLYLHRNRKRTGGDELSSVGPFILLLGGSLSRVNKSSFNNRKGELLLLVLLVFIPNITTTTTDTKSSNNEHHRQAATEMNQ